MIWQRVQDEFEKQVVALRTVTSNEDARSMSRRTVAWVTSHKLISLGTFAVAVVAITAIAMFSQAAPAEQSAAPGAELPAVVAERVVLKRIAPQITLAGTVVSKNDSQLAADVEGRVAWVADVGTIVKEGDVVARLDSTVASMQLASDKANVARLAAQLRFDRAQAERMENLYNQNAIAKTSRAEIA